MVYCSNLDSRSRKGGAMFYIYCDWEVILCDLTVLLSKLPCGGLQPYLIWHEISQDTTFPYQMPTSEKFFPWKFVLYVHIDNSMMYWIITLRS